MVANFDYYKFKVIAGTMPEACTACPFYLYSVSDDDAICFLTGSDIPTDGPQDEGRAPDCPIMPAYMKVLTLGDVSEDDIKLLKKNCILTAGSLEPVVEPKQGEWKHLKGDEWLCSNCGYIIWTEGSWEHPLERGKDYCEHCGAHMKGADDEHDK